MWGNRVTYFFLQNNTDLYSGVETFQYKFFSFHTQYDTSPGCCSHQSLSLFPDTSLPEGLGPSGSTVNRTSSPGVLV